MNQRLKELAEKANIEFTYDPTEKPIRAFAECWEDELEKFAMLIVRECMNICYRTDTEYEGHKVKSTVIASKVAEHFGVEE